ncbi:hypothetical protein C7Y72_04225 [Paraconexibacter algicola]|uniref:Methyltransferase domain-containing protein n=1 Tax=Paraconexibacter algicola TaxID=2133960 RepID=A0A2T4UI45_9ACTN|nr:hypothetical protein C7Y72_04225 [Paraconexibacter algicola]
MQVASRRSVRAPRPASVAGVAGTDPASVRTWDRLAGSYGRQERREQHAVDTALRLADPGPRDTLVDLATGTGLVLRRLAARPAQAVGVDRSAAMLAHVGPLSDDTRLLRADARDVPLPDGHADVVTISYLLHLLSPADRAAVLAEARRLLRPDPASRLVTVTVWTGRAPPARLAGRVLAAAAAARPAALGGLRPLDPTADLRAAGLHVDRRVELPRRGYPSLVLRARLPAGRTPDLRTP